MRGTVVMEGHTAPVDKRETILIQEKQHLRLQFKYVVAIVMKHVGLLLWSSINTVCIVVCMTDVCDRPWSDPALLHYVTGRLRLVHIQEVSHLKGWCASNFHFGFASQTGIIGFFTELLGALRSGCTPLARVNVIQTRPASNLFRRLCMRPLYKANFSLCSGWMFEYAFRRSIGIKCVQYKKWVWRELVLGEWSCSWVP